MHRGVNSGHLVNFGLDVSSRFEIGFVSIFFFYIIVNHFFKSDQIKFGYEVA